MRCNNSHSHSLCCVIVQRTGRAVGLLEEGTDAYLMACRTHSVCVHATVSPCAVSEGAMKLKKAFLVTMKERVL